MQKQQNGPLKWAWCEPSRWDAFNDGVNHQRKDEESTKLKLRSRSVEIQHLHTNIPTVLPCEPSPWTHRDRGPNVRYRSCQWTHRHCWVKFVWNVAVEPQTQTISGFRFRSFIWCRLSSRVNLCWFHLFLLWLRLFHVCFCREKIQLNAAFVTFYILEHFLRLHVVPRLTWRFLWTKQEAGSTNQLADV